MILLLIVAIAAIGLLAALGLKTSKTRARQRHEQLASEKRAAAAAEAQAVARAEEERRQSWADADALTSVIPAIRLPWPTQLPGSQDNGSPDLDGEYPGFSTQAPFEPAPPQRRPGRQARERGPFEPAAPQNMPSRPANGGPGQAGPANGLPRRPRPSPPAGPREPRRPAERRWQDAGPQEQMVPAQRAEPRGEEYRLPRRAPGPRQAPPTAAGQPLAPLPRPDEQVGSGIPGDPGAGDRQRKRPTHGSHRGGHAKRRRG